jgi:hypothetical protein
LPHFDWKTHQVMGEGMGKCTGTAKNTWGLPTHITDSPLYLPAPLLLCSNWVILTHTHLYFITRIEGVQIPLLSIFFQGEILLLQCQSQPMSENSE